MERDRGKENPSCTKVKREDTLSSAFNLPLLRLHAFYMLRGQLACVICMQGGRIARNQKEKIQEVDVSVWIFIKYNLRNLIHNLSMYSCRNVQIGMWAVSYAWLSIHAQFNVYTCIFAYEHMDNKCQQQNMHACMHRRPLKCLLECTNSPFYVVGNKIAVMYIENDEDCCQKRSREKRTTVQIVLPSFLILYNRLETSSELMRAKVQPSFFRRTC